MKSTKQPILPANYKHQADTRSPNEQMLSDQIVRAITELNRQRVNIRKSQPIQNTLSNQYFFLCMTGIPVFDNQFDNLQLPGEKVNYTSSGMTGTFTQNQYIQLYKEASLQKEADIVNSILQKVSPNKKIVIVFHSFGSYIMAAYYQKYGTKKIFGIIDIGGIPITCYPVLANIVKQVINLSDEFLLQNSEYIYQQYLKSAAKSSAFLPLKNKYQLIIFFKMVQEKKMADIFEWARQYPKVLKLILIGKGDLLFTESLLNEKAIFYSYVNKFEPNYENLLKKAYNKIYGVEVKNVQERFIFNFENGKHSLHMQPKLVPQIVEIIKQYLWVIDQASQIKDKQLTLKQN